MIKLENGNLVEFRETMLLTANSYVKYYKNDIEIDYLRLANNFNNMQHDREYEREYIWFVRECGTNLDVSSQGIDFPWIKAIWEGLYDSGNRKHAVFTVKFEKIENEWFVSFDLMSKQYIPQLLDNWKDSQVAV